MKRDPKFKQFVRLSLERELSKDEVVGFFQTVDQYANIEKISSFDDNGQEYEDVAVTLTNFGSYYLYDIILAYPVNPEEGEEISKEIANIIDDEFEFEATGSR